MRAYAYILIVCKFHSVLCSYDDITRKSPAGLGGGGGRCRPCLHWVLTKLGGDCRMKDKCPHKHDPKMKGSDDPSALTIAKGIKCKNHPGCKFGEACIYSHE